MLMKEGLEGVVAARSAISLINGAEGELAYRGYAIHDLAAGACFEETAYLLWHGELPTQNQFLQFDRQLRASRKLSARLSELLESLLTIFGSIDALRIAVSLLAIDDPTADDTSETATLGKGMRVTALLPTLVAAHHRLRMGQAPIEPAAELGHAANLLYMLMGQRPLEAEARAMDSAMVLQADHGLNASTFAARVTAGTLADLYSALSAAVAALKGRLHGGASREVMELILTIGDKGEVREAIDRRLRAKEVIPGFGHRVYKALDPRAVELRAILEGLAKGRGDMKWFEIAYAMEEQVERRKALKANLDLYLAPLYHMLGLPLDLFASLFACARVAGWVAHINEQHLDNRLIRPLEEYIGPLPRPFIALAGRQ